MSPPVSTPSCLAGVARLTQASQVGLVVGAAVFEWKDGVDFSDWSVSAGLEAVFTHGVCLDVTGAGFCHGGVHR